MLSESVLGAVYRCWLSSTAFALLQRLWHAVARAARGSRIFRAVFGPSRLTGYFSGSLAARLVRKLLDGVVWVCHGLVAAMRGSVVCSFFAPAIKSSRILNYEFLFGLFCCVMFIVPHDDWNNLYAVIAAVVFLALYLLLCAAGRKRLDYPDALGPGFAIFALVCVLSLLFSVARADSLRILVLFLGAFIMCWLIAVSFDDPRSLRTLIGFLYLSLLAVSLYGIMQRVLDQVSVSASFTDLRINKGVPGRVYASLDNPNNLSGFIQLFLPLGAAYAGGAKTAGRRVLLGLGLLLPVITLIMTYSRAGWLSVMLAAAVFLYFQEKKLLPALIVLALLAVPLLPRSILTRLSTITNSRDTSRNHRLAIWTAVLNLLGDKGRWLTGIGLGPDAFKEVYPDYAIAAGREGAYQSQMLYMELVLEMGILGFVSFLWMTLKYAGRIGRSIAAGGASRENRLILVAGICSFAALAVSSTVEYLWFYQRLIFAYFIWFGIMIAALRIAEREQNPLANTEQA